MCWSWKARAFAFAKVYRSRTYRPDWLKSKEVAQFCNSGWLTFLLTFTHTRDDRDRHGHEYGSLSFSTFLHLGDESRPPPGCGDWVKSLSRRLAEGEHKRLHARIEKLDLEKAISYVPRLSDQLIQPLVAHHPVALPVNINAGSLAWRPSIEEHTKVHGGSSRHRSYDQMQITRVKAVRDAPVGLIECCSFSAHRPLSCKRPMIES